MLLLARGCWNCCRRTAAGQCCRGAAVFQGQPELQAFDLMVLVALEGVDHLVVAMEYVWLVLRQVMPNGSVVVVNLKGIAS